MTTAVRPAAGSDAGWPLTFRPGPFLPGVEGLRGIAVLMIVAGVAGGADVFLAISGFLITGGLLREFDRTGRVSLLGFVARRLTRLLPTALVVLVATLVAGRVLLGPGPHPEALRSLWLPAVALVWPIGLILLLWLGFRWALAWVVAVLTVAAAPFLPIVHVVALGVGVLLGASGRVPSVRLLGVVPLTWLGRLAYPFGLWHWPVLVIAAEAYGPLPARARFVLVMASLALAVVTYVWVEEPIRRRYGRARS